MLTGKFKPLQGQMPPDQRRKSNSYVRAAGSFVPKIAAKAFEKFGFHSAEIMTDWARIIGADIAKYTEPERLKWPRAFSSSDTGADGPGTRPGGTLILRVDPARALDVEYRAAEIMDRINRYFGYRAIETLKIIQAPLKKAAPVMAAPSINAPPPGDVPVDVSVLDDGLKTALTNLWSSVQHDRPKR